MSLQEFDRREAIRSQVFARAASRAEGNRLNTSLGVYLLDKAPVGGFRGPIDDIPLSPDESLLPVLTRGGGSVCKCKGACSCKGMGYARG